MPYLDRAGKPRLYYELNDYTDPWDSRPYMILQHGFSRSSRFWFSWVPYLSRFYRVVRPDMRGLGQSERNFNLETGISFDELLGDLVALVDALGAESVHFCGESSGGMIGLAFAAEHPDRVRTLSIVSSPLYLTDREKESTNYGYSSRIEALQKLGPRGWVEASNAGRRFATDTDPGMLRWYVDEMGKSDIDVLVAITRWLMDASAVPYLRKVKAPVLGLYPSHGPIIGDEHLRQLREQVADIKIVSVPSRYASIQNFKPAACALEVLHFAAQHDGMTCHE